MPTGIKNIGNSCYVSAALQSSVCILYDIFNSGDYVKYIDYKSVRTITNISDLIISMKDNNNSNIVNYFHDKYLYILFNDLKRLDNFPDFTEKVQSDSFIFFVRFLDYISDSIEMKIKSIKINIKETKLNKDERLKLELKLFKKKSYKNISS